jgi:hypothetical protein
VTSVIQFLNTLITTSGNFLFYESKVLEEDLNWPVIFYQCVEMLCNAQHSFSRYSASQILLNFIVKKHKDDIIMQHRDWMSMLAGAIKTADMNLKINITKIFQHYVNLVLSDPKKWGNDRIYMEIAKIMLDGICNFRNADYLLVNLETMYLLTEMEITRDIILVEEFATRLVNLLHNRVNTGVDSILIKCLIVYLKYKPETSSSIEKLVLECMKRDIDQ